jgi:predicted dehydrogenase
MIRIVIVGLNFGRHIVDDLAGGQPGVQLAGVCDLDRGKVEASAAQHGVRAYTSLDAVLADPSVDAVGLFTGPGGRGALIERCVAAGKHVMTTKPFELDADAGARALAAARAAGRVVHLNSPGPRPSDDLAIIARWRGEHDLGRLVAAQAEVWAHYREQADGSWYDDPVRCPVAPLYRLGIYLINDLLSLAGPVARVQVETSRLFTGRPTPDQAQVGLRFASGALGHVFASFCIEDGDHYRNAMTLHFAHGTIYRNVGAQRRGSACELALVRGDGNRREVIEAVAARSSGHYDWPAFAADVASRTPLAEDVAAVALDGIRVMAAISRSERAEAPVVL